MLEVVETDMWADEQKVGISRMIFGTHTGNVWAGGSGIEKYMRRTISLAMTETKIGKTARWCV